MGGAKLTVQLRGRPLVSYPLSALQAAVDEVAVIAKASTALPNLPGVTVWIEPDEPVHPLLGIGEALALAEGRPVLSCPADLPLVSSEMLGALARARRGSGDAVLAVSRGAVQPLLGCFWPSACAPLIRAAREGMPAREAVRALHPAFLEVSDERDLFNVNTPDDLLQAAAMLDGLARERAQLKVKS